MAEKLSAFFTAIQRFMRTIIVQFLEYGRKYYSNPHPLSAILFIHKNR